MLGLPRWSIYFLVAYSLTRAYLETLNFTANNSCILCISTKSKIRNLLRQVIYVFHATIIMGLGYANFLVFHTNTKMFSNRSTYQALFECRKSSSRDAISRYILFFRNVSSCSRYIFNLFGLIRRRCAVLSKRWFLFYLYLALKKHQFRLV